MDPAASVRNELGDTEKIDAETLANLLPQMTDPSARRVLRTELFKRDPFPAKPLVKSLTHLQLAVRLGALELLEEFHNADFRFDPWIPPDDPRNAAPLEQWKNWSEQTHALDERDESNLLDPEQRRSYLRDLLGDQPDKATRARHMLQADGLAAVGFLEEFLAESETLPPGHRARIRQAQYQIVLARPFGDQAATTARNLAFGSRDQILTALDSLRRAGLAALPIVRDFLRHNDPLIRESAIDSMLAAGGQQTLSIVAPVIKDETDTNVIHGALRRIKDISGSESLDLAASFLDHEDDDLVVSAIRSCQSLVGGSSSFSSSRTTSDQSKQKPTDVQKKIITLLEHPEWRVRTAALEFITERKVSAATDKVVELLNDPDEFVRFSAIKAATALGAEDAPPKLKALFLEDPSMVGPVIQGYAAMGLTPDAEMLEALSNYPPDARLAIISAAENNSNLSSIVHRFASDPNLDVACAALRYLGADDERVQSNTTASILLNAYQSDSPEKRRAVLARLELPKTGATDPAVARALERYTTNNTKTHLDPLYNAFLQVDESSPAERPLPSVPGALGKFIDALLESTRRKDDDWFRAAMPLARANHPTALSILIERLPTLSTAQKAAIAEELYNPTQREAVRILRRLIQDPVPDIRNSAVSSALSNTDAPAFVSMVLEELEKPDSQLQAHDLYSYRFEYAARSGATSRILRNWATKVIRNEERATSTRVLAFIALSRSMPSGVRDDVLNRAEFDPSPWIRRAAWYALGTGAPNLFHQHLEKLTADQSPWVRAVLPEVTGANQSSWQHRFSDIHQSKDNSWSYDRDERRLNDRAADALKEMAASDSSADNRFEAGFALLSHGRPVNVEKLAELLARQPKENYASRRMASWMRSNSSRLGPGLAPLVSALNTSEINADQLHTIATAIGTGDQNAGFTSFAGLVASADQAKDATQLNPKSDEPETQPERDTLTLIYFHKPGCRECARAAEILDALKPDFPLLKITRYNILESDATILNQALCDRLNVPSNRQNIAPSFFTQGGFLVGDDITPAALGRLLSDTMDLPQNDSWHVIEKPDLKAAREQVDDRYESLTLPIVLIAGLADGVNPCAFATIIFLLSYLQIARRTPREMLMVGAAFILAVFITYFAAGLALHRLIEALTEEIQGIQKWLNWIFGLLALIAAGLSFRDAAIARRGRPEDMTLQLPAFLKDRIRSTIRTGARARRYVIAAFLVGIVISLLELACTGQVYAPIIYKIQQGNAGAIGLLTLYNLAFILPLVVIFIAAWAGFGSEALLRLQKKSTVSIKVILGLVFLALAAMILFGSKFL